MPFHDAFLEAYTRTKQLQQQQARLELEKQLNTANIEHMQLTGKVLQAESKRQAHEQAIKDMEAQQGAIASGASFAPAPAASTDGNVDESGAPLASPDTGPGATSAPGGNVIQTPFGAMTAPGPAEIANIVSERARRVAQATGEGEQAGGLTQQDLTINVPGMAPVKIPKGTPAKAIPEIISGAAGVRGHQIAASATTTGLIQALTGQGGFSALGGPGGQPSPPAAPGGAPGGATAVPGTAPAAATPTPRDEAIAKVPPFFRPQVQALLDHTADPAKVSQRSPIGIMTMNYVHQIDPNWNEGTYKQRFALQKSFTSGEESNNIKAVNTAAAHLATVSEAAEALKNGDIQLFNRLKNSFETAVGMPEVNDYNLASHVAAQEVAKVIHGAGVVPEGQGEKVDKTASAVNSPAQLDGMFAMAAHLMEGRMAAIQNKYTQGMGKAPDRPLFMPEALASITKLKQKAAGGKGGNVGRFERVQ